MQNTQEILARGRIQSLLADYWRRVDGTTDAPVDALFAEDAQLVMGTMQLHGRDAIAAFYEQRALREAAARRTTRHLATNLSLAFVDAHRVRAYATVQVFSGQGELPLPSRPAATVADIEDLLHEVSPGTWRITHRRYRLVFSDLAPAA